MIRKEEKIQSKLIENLVSDAIPVGKKDILLVSADLDAMAGEMALEDIETALDQVLGRVTAIESAKTEEKAQTAANAAEAEQNIKKIRARSAKIINLTRKKKRVRRVVVKLLQCQSHDVHDIRIRHLSSLFIQYFNIPISLNSVFLLQLTLEVFAY